ncbi:AAA family ATPase [Streptomyces sp. A7024]|uniref:AAA family ATPase n=1 Tax=Streptomyces coryli TaxID=1128680 RepID=A0A6G4TVL2_9ACTN|nr:AAA family ATPase [Streptomyces coryli]NGN64025.1 AAA family ATPase [Streptomyces coryli]
MLDGVTSAPHISPVFVGRAVELDALAAALGRAAGGVPQAMLVGGEAGVGKSRLVEEFLHAAEAEGAVVAVGGCVEAGAEGLPFAPLTTALRSLRRTLGSAMDEAAAGREGELAGLLPELGDLGERIGEAGARPEAAARGRLFDLTARLLERLAADRPLVLVVEDLHWADRSTRELLAYLLRSLGAARLLILATYRTDDLDRRHPLRPALAELDRLRSVQRVELPRLTRAEVAGQIAGIRGAEPDAALLDAVFSRADGNAFFVEELALSGGAAHGGPLSDSLRDLLLVRIEALPEEVQRVVRIAAGGGSTVEYELLAAVTGLPEDELIAALRAAVDAGVLQPAADSEAFRFRHALLREAVADDLLPGERHQVARRYAEALVAAPGLVRPEERAARLASFWHQARDPARALPATLQAAADARRRHAYAEQLQLLDRAVELWDEAPEEAHGGQDLMDLLADVVVAARLTSELERALSLAKQALRLLDRRPQDADTSLRAAWFWTERSIGVQLTARGDGWEELAKAEALVRGLPPSPVHAYVLSEVATWQALHTPGREAMETAQRAVDLARLVGDEQTELHVRIPLGWMTADTGDVEGGLAEMYEVRRRAVALGTPLVIQRAYINLPDCLEGLGRSAEALERGEEAVELMGRYGLTEPMAMALSNQANSLISLGRWAAADAAATEVGRAVNSPKRLGSAARARADLAILRGDREAAAAQLAEARKHLDTHDVHPQYSLPIIRADVTIAAAGGHILEVRALLARAAAEGFPLGMQRYAWPLLYEAAAAEADARVLPAAQAGRGAAVTRIREAMRGLPQFVPVWAAQALDTEAELLTADGSDAAAAERWAEAVAAWEPLDWPYHLARARFRYGQALLAARPGERPAPAALLRQAHETAAELGAAPLAAEIAALAARARVALTDGDHAAVPQDPAQELGLTSRERDVLRLVATGRSNRQIADELFISPKTASVHVSNILAKLGVSSRGEAAAAAHRLRLFEDGLS